VQSEKAPLLSNVLPPLISLIVEGSVTLCNLKHCPNAPPSIVSTPSGIIRLVIPVRQKASLGITFILPGNVNEERLLHSIKALSSIIFKPSDKCAEVRL